MMYNAILVELGYFETVTVGFLIIGHTHASIDQYFSCLRKLIRRASFIASPLALQHLFSLEKSVSETSKSKMKSKYRPPLRQIQLLFTHDYKTALAPYRNKSITNYGVPYQFKFFMLCGKCVCQYKQFSDPLLQWLPVMPFTSISSLEQLFNRRIFEIEDNFSLSTSRGLTSFQQHIGLSSSIEANEIINNKNVRELADAMQKTLPALVLSERKGMTEQELRRCNEADGVSDILRYSSNDTGAVEHSNTSCSSLIETQKSMQNLNTKSKGILINIDL